MPPKKSNLKRIEDLKIEPIPSTDPEARDEGPRLIPLRPAKEQIVAGKRFLDLADRALNGPEPKK